MRLQTFINDRAQSMFEITIALGIMVIVIGALTVAILVGLRNSQFSQNQIQATKLAQAGVEFIKSVRERNGLICFNDPPTSYYYWDPTDTSKTNPPYALIWTASIDPSPTKYYYLLQNAAEGECYLTDVATVAEGENALNGGFTRKVSILDTGTNQRKFTVIVSWSDSSGVHQTQLVTILSNH